MIELAVAVAGAKIGREHLRLGVVLHQKADRNAAVRATVLDGVEPLPSRYGLAAVEPLDQHKRREIGPIHGAINALVCEASSKLAARPCSRNLLNKRYPRRLGPFRATGARLLLMV